MCPARRSREGRILDPLALAVAVAKATDDKKADDIVMLCMTDLLAVTDYFVICSASNRILMDAIGGEAEVRAQELGVTPTGREGRADGGWLLIDFGAVVLHIFSTESREYYRLDKLWGGAPVCDWQAAEPACAAAGDAAEQGA